MAAAGNPIPCLFSGFQFYPQTWWNTVDKGVLEILVFWFSVIQEKGTEKIMGMLKG